MDTTYFGRSFGVMVFLDAVTGRVLHHKFVKYETNADYQQGINHIMAKDTSVHAIVCDIRRGLTSLFDITPVQLCQFHQIQIINRYLTKKPKSEAAFSLRQIALTLTQSHYEQFQALLDAWCDAHKAYLNERSINPDTGKTWFTHKHLRSAYFSLKRNSDWLFTFDEYPYYRIPNTTNKLESLFSQLKQQLRCHQGLNIQRKQKFINHFLATYHNKS